MRFITHDGEKITGVYSGDPGSVNHPTTPIPETFQGRTGMPLAMLDDQWRVRPMRDLIAEDLVEVPEGLEWDDTKGDFTPKQDDEPELSESEKIIAKLNTIDFQSIRPVRAILAGNDTQADRDKLANLEAEAQKLRKTVNRREDVTG